MSCRRTISLDSPIWKMDPSSEKNARLYLNLDLTDDEIDFCLIGCGDYGWINDKCEIFLLSSSGKIALKKKRWRGNLRDSFFSILKNAIFGDNKESILSNDTLTVCCKIREKTIKTGEFRLNVVIHKLNYSWKIENFSPSEFYTKTFIENENLLFYMTLERNNEELISQNIFVGGVTIKHGTLRFLDSKFRIKDTGSEEMCLFVKLNQPLQTAWKGFINIDESYSKEYLQLEFESIFSVYTSTETVSRVSNTLSSNLRQLYKEQLYTDATLNTADGKSFSAHRCLLAARSPVFRAMFEKDQMSEGRSGVVNIDDVDSETVDRMLVFLYSDSIEGVQWEEVSALYYAADKYDILSLKRKCADILMSGLTVDNACDTLVLADAHSDQELMRCVVDFICDHQEVVYSGKWKVLEKKNPGLTSKILRKLFLKCKRRK